ncbi:MAG: trimethylamine methyltransferase family protein, partial [Gammaproteobacteria bacterium]|nr:trimethylamine methyltransferase family protein [Gammaproteobacteria bacterium]
EMLQMMAEYLRPIEVNDDTLALEAIEEAGAGGHFFGVGHTMSRYETAFYQPMLTEQRNFESWAEAGSEDALARANQIWKKLLREYVAPPLDPAVDEELEAYVARRKAHGNPG